MISLAEAFLGKGATDYTVKPTQTCVGGRKKACCDARVWRNGCFRVASQRVVPPTKTKTIMFFCTTAENDYYIILLALLACNNCKAILCRF